MGVRGLKSFMEKHDGLFIKDHQLHDTHIVIDASNFMCALYIASQKHERRDLFGGDMVQYGCYLSNLFVSLRRCNVVPILVFDGAQTYDQNKSKTAEKHRRALDRFQSVMSINKLGFGDFILPATATNVFRSVAVDHGIKIVQCMFEADSEVARIAQEHNCPVISNDSDFFLMNLPHGLITIDHFHYEKTILNKPDATDSSTHHYIECWLFKQENFLRYVPGLDTNTLPLLGVLAGNDFISSSVFDQISKRLSACHDSRDAPRSFKKVTGNQQHQKISRILNFFSGKTSNQLVNLICAQAPKDKRAKLKSLIKSNLTVYDIPISDDFEKELRNLYWRGFQLTYKNLYGMDQLLYEFDQVMECLTSWLRRAMEESVLSYRCLELANQNIIFIINHMDDPTLSSAHECQGRTMKVMLALLRSSHKERLTCLLYDRVGKSYSKKVIRPLTHLDNFGPLNFTFYDLPQLPESTRRSILLATFYSSWQTFQSNMMDFYGWFESMHSEEFLTIKLLLDFIDLESPTAKLWKHFRQAVLLCFIYYLLKSGRDRKLADRLEDVSGQDEEFIKDFFDLVKKRNLAKMPVLNKKRKYNCRLMHQITQLQCSIISFNGLNAFLGDLMTRVRTEYWLNSCLIYNLSEHLHNKTLRLPTLPEIIHIRPK